MDVTFRKDPIIPTVAAIEDKQRCIDYWGDRCCKAEAENLRLRSALQSIANNTCCEGCQEAAKVARAALNPTATGSTLGSSVAP